jgi:hypothetical protein
MINKLTKYRRQSDQIHAMNEEHKPEIASGDFQVQMYSVNTKIQVHMHSVNRTVARYEMRSQVLIETAQDRN